MGKDYAGTYRRAGADDVNYTEEDLLALIERGDEHEAFYRQKLEALRTEKRTALVAELRGFAEGSTSARASLMRDAADAIEALMQPEYEYPQLRAIAENGVEQGEQA